MMWKQILPSCLILTTLACIYYRYRELTVVQGILKGLRPAVVAMIGSAGLSLFSLSLFGQNKLPADFSGINWISAAIFAVCLFVLRKWKVNPIFAIIGAGVSGVLLYSIF